jgi:hypothetical protein
MAQCAQGPDIQAILRGSALHSEAQERVGGEGEIRTPDEVAPMPHFECGAFNHSATSPHAEGPVDLAASITHWSVPQARRDHHINVALISQPVRLTLTRVSDRCIDPVRARRHNLCAFRCADVVVDPY